MPLDRSNTGRSKSRSPIPPAYINHSSPGRAFLPPSHYAAAAGIAYTGRKSPADFEHNGLATKAPTTSKDNVADNQGSYHSVFMPVSYPSESEPMSDSSFEFKSTSGSRYSQSEEKHVIKSSLREKRQSHITGLPLLETHLLPSLRDTIDRMTRIPARAAAPSSSTSSLLEIPSSLGSSRLVRSPPSAQSYSAVDASYLGSPHVEVKTPSTSRDAKTNPEPAPSKIPSRSVTPIEPSTPRSRLPAKSSLKSALRAPIPKSFHIPSPVEGPISHSPSTGVSLKSVRNILSRKTSTTSISESTLGVAGRKPMLRGTKQTAMSSLVLPRHKSRTDPGSSSTVEPPFLDSQDDIRSVSYSSIPRSKNRLNKGALPWARTVQADDSDLEYRYEAEGRDRRKLVVANAEVFASSSESELENKGEFQRGKADKGKREVEKGSWNSRGATGGIGLGLDLRLSKDTYILRKEKAHRGQEKNWRPQLEDSTDSPPSQLSFHSPQFSIHHRHDDRDPSGSLEDSDADHNRRRAALLGIVSGLEFEAPALVPRDSEDSEYCGEEGFAISGSGDLSGGSTGAGTIRTIEPDGPNLDFGDESQGHKSTRRGRPRSRSHMPTFVVSTEDEDSGDPERHNDYDQHPQPSKHPTTSCTPSPNIDTKNRRPPSRSPVIHQADLSLMPSAVKRHTVYHRSLSPNNSDRTMVEGPNLKGYAPILRKYEFVQEQQESEDSDAVNIARRSHAAAARERRAFGIPPSESVEVYQGEQYQKGGQILTHAESDLSSVGSLLWNEDLEELSQGAETLFRKLNGNAVKEIDRRSRQHTDQTTRTSIISRRSSASSIYEDQVTEDAWRSQSTLSLARDECTSPDVPTPTPVPVALEGECGDQEMERQALICEISQTEEAFVNRLHTFIRLFVLPLRVQDSKTWIFGVPSEVARLFDWLDDIMNLHSQILASLKSIRAKQYPVVERIAESIRVFVPRFEIYQPYLVRLADVTTLINELVQDEFSDFGEFVDIQERSLECEGWTFEMFLAEPVKRLAKYPEFFSKLVGLTPKSHVDYLSTFSLYHSTDIVIRVMTEVKVREDEYVMIKGLATQIQGLPATVELATRERRLLFHGILQLINIDDERVNGDVFFSHGHTTVTSGTNPPNRSNRLANAIDLWDARRGRSGSTSSSSTGTSFTSFGTTSSGASLDLPVASSPFFSSFRIPLPEGRLKKTKTSRSGVPPSPSPISRRTGPHGIPVQVFVFTDLVILATPDPSSMTSSGWTLLQKIGIIRILGVIEPPKQDYFDSDLFIVEALPVDIDKLNQGLNDENGFLVSLRLAVPNQESPCHSEKSPSQNDKIIRLWISAFQQCLRNTLRSISLPSLSKSYDPHRDLELDTQETVFSLLASGLPLPKSPSGQIMDFQEGQAKDIQTQEREERGWWSLRFQQVFRELQRQDMASAAIQ